MRIIKSIIVLVVIVATVFISVGSLSGANDEAAIYLLYGSECYEFRYDWRDYQKYPGDWLSINELRAWLEYDTAPIILRANKSGVVYFSGQCEDVAFQARDRAYDMGKRLDTEILTMQECYRYRQYVSGDISKLGYNGGHYINKAVIGNEVWFVEVITDKIWLAYYLD